MWKWSAASESEMIGTIPLQRGNEEHPQNALPVLLPWRAVRFTMAAPHKGQTGGSDDTPFAVPALFFAIALALSAC